MRSASLIRYDIFRLESRALPLDLRETVRLAKLREKLPAAARRELKQLAKTLTYKADVYRAGFGRIYPDAGKWSVRPVGASFGLFLADTQIDPDSLCDGHGRTITADSNY